MATLKGIFPNPKPTRRKNFIQENVRNLRRMEQFFHTKEVEDLQKLQLQTKSADKYRNVSSRINSSLRSGKSPSSLRKNDLRHSDTNLEAGGCHLERKLSDPIVPKKVANGKFHRSPVKMNSAVKPKKGERLQSSKNAKNGLMKASSNVELCRKDTNATDGDETVSAKYRNQGIQTLGTDDMGTLYKEGIIRYPSGGISKNNSTPLRKKDVSSQQESPRSDRGDILPTSPRRQSSSQSNSPLTTEDLTDHVAMSKQKSTVASKMATQLNNGVLPANYRKGVVPKYIRDRKEALQQRDEKIKAAISHADCPEGHVPLPDEERKETLRMLKKHYQEYVNELNMMPIKTDTLRSQRRKMEIEKQLNKLEEGIKVFSRPKVYVKINA